MVFTELLRWGLREAGGLVLSVGVVRLPPDHAGPILETGAVALHLQSFSVCGFRSLTLVKNIPVSQPTVLAGHNDGGKSALLTALAFLVGAHRLTDEDRTYASGEADNGGRCSETWVEGSFLLDAHERDGHWAPELRIRRRAVAGQESLWEYWGRQPVDPGLRDLDKLTKTQLGDVAKKHGVSAPAGVLKDELRWLLEEFVGTTDQVDVWAPLPKALVERLPQLLVFGGSDESPDNAVRVALNSCYEAHLQDDTLQGRVRDIEAEITQRLEKDADALCAHIRMHCADLVGVAVKPEVSFRGGFKRAPLLISRADGEPVDLSRSGQGSSRRIALAIWEWTSELLEKAELAEDSRPPVQTIVVYDEPDTHLDYRHQRTVMEIIRRQCGMPHVHVMVATHSMNLIDGVDIADVVHLKLDAGGRTMVERLGEDTHGGIDTHLGNIAAAVGLRNSVLLHERCFLAVEGPTEEQNLPLLFRLSEGLSLQAAGVALWACNNNEGALHLARYLKEHSRTVMLMVDADSRNLALFRDERLRRFGLDPKTDVSMLGEAQGFNEFEELFTAAQWADAANAHWPRADDGAWLPDHFDAHRLGKKFSADILRMIKADAATSPNGKPDMVYGLVTRMKSRSDVPEPLRDAFADLRALAR